MVLVIPYSYSWTSSAYKIASMVQAKNMGVNALKFAFVIADGNNVAKDIDYNLNDLKQFKQAGGKLVISFGGAAGTMIDEAINDVDRLYNSYMDIIKKTGVKALDFDIEGGNVGKSYVHNRRNVVLNKLLWTYPDLYISYTLAADTNGLGSDSLNIVKAAINSGVSISVVNVMLMDNGWGDTGSAAISSAETLKNQLKNLWPKLTDQQIYNKIGMTMMIGKNDDLSTCTVDHARQISAYAHGKGIGELSYWALQRDVAGPNDYNYASLVNKNDLDFYNAFNSVNTINTVPILSPIPISIKPIISLIKPNWINQTYFGRTIVQDTRPNWAKVDNLVMGDQSKYAYIMISNRNIGELLDGLSGDSNAQVVNYNWTTGIAYVKKGTDPSVYGDTSTKTGFTAFIKLF
jgi:hypothetical protein